jgi:hypothetical protein
MAGMEMVNLDEESGVKYILRRVIWEDRWQSQLEELVDLCRRVPIEEVLLMEQSHQVLMVPYPLDVHRRFAAIYEQMARTLREHGVRFSVNIATLIGHEDADVPASMILQHQKFVGENLKPAQANYCILDEAWQAYAAEVCVLYARSKPETIFVDDDFRSINHGVFLGCFCPVHVARVGERMGMTLTNEMLLKAVTGPNEIDRKIRSAWMEVTFEGQLQAASKIQQAVETISPSTRLGLMNSGEPSHSVQGRDMDPLLREFSGPTRRPLSRPCGNGYGDALRGDVVALHQGMALSLSVLGDDVEIVSEVENWPHTRYTKSLTLTRRQMQLHTLAGADALTLNLYDYLATPFAQDSDFEKLLHQVKGELRVLQEARRGKRLKGFGLPWKKDMARYRTCPTGSSGELCPDRPLDLYLPRFGVPVQFTPARGNALMGDDVLAFSDTEIIEFLQGGLLLDGLAADHLQQRGFGEYLGCRTVGTLEIAAVERLDVNDFTGSFAGNNLTTDWFRLRRQGREIFRLEKSAESISLSTILDLDLKELSPGMVLYENKLGGRVAVLAVPSDPWAWLYRSRAYTLGKIIHWLMFDTLPVWIEDCPDVAPFYYEDPKSGEALLALVNGSLDPMPINLHSGRTWIDLFSARQTILQSIEPIGIGFYYGEA